MIIEIRVIDFKVLILFEFYSITLGMKKSALLLVIVLAFAVFTSAQKSKLSGSWLLTKVEVGGEVH